MRNHSCFARIVPRIALLGILLSAQLFAQLSNVKTVFVILFENHNWSDIKGSSSAPYINNTLLPMASRAEQYFNPPGIHPSLPNYLWLEAGTSFGITNDSDPSVNHQSTISHLVTQLNTGGISWKTYQENITGTACPLTSSYPYAPKHNPVVYFDDVTGVNNPSSAYCISHVRPYTEFASDLAANNVARYVFITPNLCNDMHDSCSPLNNPIKQGDTWLSNEIPKILNSSAYQNGGAIFITWDEGEGGSDGPIGMIVLSPFAKGGGYSNTIHYTHGSMLRTAEEIFGVPLIRDAANQTNLSDLFRSQVDPPAAPANLTATAGSSQVSLAWSGSSGAVSYNVKRATISGGPYGTIASGVTPTSFLDTAVINGTTYYYAVTAVNGAGESSNSNQASATPAQAPIPVYQIDCGGAAVDPYQADAFFTGGQSASTTSTISLGGVTNPAPQAVYQTWRTGSKKAPAFSYLLPGLTPGAAYTVRLHFSENTAGRTGSRRFNVSINGTQELSNFDVFAAAGKNHALVRSFTSTADAGGRISIAFTAVTNQPPIINGIEVLH